MNSARRLAVQNVRKYRYPPRYSNSRSRGTRLKGTHAVVQEADLKVGLYDGASTTALYDYDAAFTMRRAQGEVRAIW